MGPHSEHEFEVYPGEGCIRLAITFQPRPESSYAVRHCGARPRFRG